MDVKAGLAGFKENVSARQGIWAEMHAPPRLDPALLAPPSLEVSLLIPARGAAHALAGTVSAAHEFLSRHYAPGSFEIILIPNPGAGAGVTDPSTKIAHELASRHDCVRVRPHAQPRGKGAALRTGFAGSRGRWVFFTDADLPYDLDFFEQAACQLRAGFDLVTGNRRLPTSVFDLPVHLLRVAHGRHRLGLLFNRVVRMLMPIETTDTQAGIKAMSRRLAVEAFTRQRCPGFFFDLEIFLSAQAHGYLHVELPVTLRLNSEKSTVRLLRESWLAAYWLARIAIRARVQRGYDPAAAPRATSAPARILSRYRGCAPGTRLFLRLRWRLTPYGRMAAQLPPRGLILDLGCGHGLFSLALAMEGPQRQVIGLDHDPARVELARWAGYGLPNLRFTQGTLSAWRLAAASTGDPGPAGPRANPASTAGISMIDVLHYFAPQEQERLLAQAFELLSPGGRLLVREVDPAEGMMSPFNRFYEKMATTTGFTRSERKRSLHFRTRDDWEETLRSAGFAVTSGRCSSALFADILYVCLRPVGRGNA